MVRSFVQISVEASKKKYPENEAKILCLQALDVRIKAEVI